MPYYNGKYLTDSEVEQISNNLFGEELDDFRSSLTSSNSGGDFVGGFIGEELFDDD